jgi:hypothetical protein
LSSNCSFAVHISLTNRILTVLPRQPPTCHRQVPQHVRPENGVSQVDVFLSGKIGMKAGSHLQGVLDTRLAGTVSSGPGGQVKLRVGKLPLQPNVWVVLELGRLFPRTFPIGPSKDDHREASARRGGNRSTLSLSRPGAEHAPPATVLSSRNSFGVFRLRLLHGSGRRRINRRLGLERITLADHLQRNGKTGAREVRS